MYKLLRIKETNSIIAMGEDITVGAHSYMIDEIEYRHTPMSDYECIELEIIPDRVLYGFAPELFTYIDNTFGYSSEHPSYGVAGLGVYDAYATPSPEEIAKIDALNTPP